MARIADSFVLLVVRYQQRGNMAGFFKDNVLPYDKSLSASIPVPPTPFAAVCDFDLPIEFRALPQIKTRATFT